MGDNLGNLETSEKTAGQWLKETVCEFGEKNKWTVKDAVEGTQVFGATGSGKTSGSGKALAKGMLKAGFGGLVLTAKTDELDTWLGYFRSLDRQEERQLIDPREDGRLVVVEPSGAEKKYTFNPLAYEYKLSAKGADPSGGTATTRLVNLFMAALGSGDGSVSRADPYWDDALREMLSHSVDLITFGGGKVSENGLFFAPKVSPTLQEIQDVIRTAPLSLEEARSKDWQDGDGACQRFLREADKNYQLMRRESEAANDLADTFQYWTRSFPGLADRTRSVVLSSFSAKASGLLRRPLRDLLCSDSPDVEDGGTELDIPKACYKGKVVLVNLPVKSFGDVGSFAQKLIKTVWQHAVEMRDVKTNSRPVFLWVDEAQHFVTAEDVLYQATARSKLAATVYLTQNIPNYYTAMGGANSSATDALLGSLQTKIFHTNGDAVTNEWAEKLLGQADKTDKVKSWGHSAGVNSRSDTEQESEQIRRLPQVPAIEFSTLLRGGGKEPKVGSIIYHAGKEEWKDIGGYLEHTFEQEESA